MNNLTTEDIRRWNARVLADRAGGVARFAERIERAQAQVSHVIGKNPIKPIETKLARHIESACDVPHGWLDSPHVREWLNIHATAWAASLRAELAAVGVTVDSAVPASGPEAELMTLYGLMNERTRSQLLSIAHVLHDPGSNSADSSAAP
jgi:hypothetical protein